MVWSAETPDGLSIIVAGLKYNEDTESDEGMIWKINSDDGEIDWEMPYDNSERKGKQQSEFETI